MKKNYIFTLIVSLLFIAVQGQKKSELLLEISNLKTELDSTKTVLTEAKKTERVSVAKSDSYEKQVLELQDANATLLKNLNSFATLSSKNSENINRALNKLKEKENQLNAINEALAQNDSTTLVVLTSAKQTLGENAKLALTNGGLIISSSLNFIFSKPEATTVSEKALPWLEKIAAILKANPKTNLTIEGLSMTGELNTAAQQALAVANILKKNTEIDPSRISATGKDGNLKEGINLFIHADYPSFYNMVKNHMKNVN